MLRLNVTHGLSVHAARRSPVPFMPHQQQHSRRQAVAARTRLVCATAADPEVAQQDSSAFAAGIRPAPADNILYALGRMESRPTGTPDGQLKELFEGQPGFKSIDVALNPDTGAYISYAVFESVEAAQAARKALRRATVDGRKVVVGTHKRVDEPSNKAADTSGEGSIDSNADSSKADGSQAGNSEQRQRRRELRQQPRRPRNSSGDQASTLFVQNLAWATMDEDLKEHFSGCEGLADAFITFNKEGRPSGVGFVRFDSPAAAAAAAKALDGSELDGRQIKVAPAGAARTQRQPSTSSSSDAPPAAGSGGASTASPAEASKQQPRRAALQGASDTETRAVVHQLPEGFTWREVLGMCSVFGEVRKVLLSKPKVEKQVAAGEAGEAVVEQGEQDGALPQGDSEAADEAAEIGGGGSSSGGSNGSGDGGRSQQERLRTAVVFMADRQAAERVVTELDGREVQGSRLRVNLYRTRVQGQDSEKGKVSE